MTKLKENFGTALLHHSLPTATAALWEGDLTPQALPMIEKTLRAMLVGKRLGLIPIDDVSGSSAYADSAVPGSADFARPFDDHLLDYEFFDTQNALPRMKLDHASDWATEKVKATLIENFRAALPSNLKRSVDAAIFEQEWFQQRGGPLEDELLALDPDKWDQPDEDDDPRAYMRAPFSPEIFLERLSWINRAPESDIKLILELMRSGYHIYGDAPVFSACDQLLFAQWPDQIFNDLSADYQSFAQMVRGPGTGLELPIVTALVMSRASKRSDIPRAIVEMRDEYANFRNELWDLLSEMFTSSSVQRQAELLKKLRPLGASIFKTSVGRKFDALSLGAEAAGMSVTGFFNNARQQAEPFVRVHSVSFAQKMSHHIINILQSNHAILLRHLSQTERRDFGML